MKKIILFLSFLCLLISQTQAYEPTINDIKSINKLKENLWDISNIK
jgi:hypothetical protein